MNEHMRVRIVQRLEELRPAVETLIHDISQWDRLDLRSSITPVPTMVAYGILSQLAADLAIVAEDHDTAHAIMELSERLTAAVRALHRRQHENEC